MRLMHINELLRLVLMSAQHVLFIVAILTLGYCGFVLVDARVFQSRESRGLDRLLRDQRAASEGAPLTDPSRPFKSTPAVERDGPIGRIEIPRLGVSVIVAEGVDTTTLRRAAGHIPGTALPGGPGNVGIAGHRDTFFRPLRNIRRNDIITLTTQESEYCYRVVSMRVVSPAEVSVLIPDQDEILTLVTCYPFYFVGAAPYRFIVRAERAPRAGTSGNGYR